MYTEKLNLDSLRSLFKAGKEIPAVNGIVTLDGYSANEEAFKMHLIEDRLMMEVSKRGETTIYKKTESFYAIPI